MQMRDRFSGVGTVVDHQTVAATAESKFCRHFVGFDEQMTQEILIFFFGVADARDVLFWNYQNMNRGLWGDVSEGEHLVVFVDNVGRNLAGDDFFENIHKTIRAVQWLRGSALQQVRR